MFKISYSILIIRLSFLFWAIIASLFIGIEYLLIGLILSVFCYKKDKKTYDQEPIVAKESIWLLIIIILLMTTLSLPNMFFILSNSFSNKIVSQTIDNANSNVGKGRTITELLGNLFTLTPFLIVDLRKRFSTSMKLLVGIPIIIQWIVISGASRGMLSIIIFSIFIPSIKNWKKLLLFGISFLLLYNFISIYRDGRVNYIANPILDSFLFPGYNLLLLSQSNFHIDVIEYISQFFLKFIPTLIYDKKIYSFNIEMTKIIYPYMMNEVSSISVFTYMGDFLIYKPIIITILFSVVVLRIITKYLLRIILKYNFTITSLYISLYYFIALRSRIFDLLSMLILYLLLLTVFDIVNRMFLSINVKKPLL